MHSSVKTTWTPRCSPKKATCVGFLNRNSRFSLPQINKTKTLKLRWQQTEEQDLALKFLKISSQKSVKKQSQMKSMLYSSAAIAHTTRERSLDPRIDRKLKDEW